MRHAPTRNMFLPLARTRHDPPPVKPKPSPENVAKMGKPRHMEPVTNPWGLTGKQYHIAKMHSEGASSHQLAAMFDMSEKTVRTHLDRVQAKMGADNIHRIAYMWYHFEHPDHPSYDKNAMLIAKLEQALGYSLT